MNPFEAVLGREAIDRLSPAVKEHFSLATGSLQYKGVMTRVWRKTGFAGLLSYPVLYLASLSDILFVEVGEDIPFELENSIVHTPDRKDVMTWDRKFHFPSGTRRFYAVMAFDDSRQAILDYFGKNHFLEAELHAAAKDGSLSLVSGRQFVRWGRVRFPLPKILAGKATIREWEDQEGTMRIKVTVSNPMFGDVFGYEGRFSRVQ